MTQTAAALPADDREAIEALLTEFYWRLDHVGTGSVADLFTESGTLVTPRFELSGREQIANWFVGRPQRITRHSWSNLRLSQSGKGAVAANAHVMTAAMSSEGAIELLVGDTIDLVVREASGGWRFSTRCLTIAMEGRLAINGCHAS